MSRLILSASVMWTVLYAPAPLRAEDAEDKAAARVEKRGGDVVRDEGRPGKPVVRVKLRSETATVEDLRALAPLRNLVALDLSHARIGTKELKELPTLPNLTTLNLRLRGCTKIQNSVSRYHTLTSEDSCPARIH